MVLRRLALAFGLLFALLGFAAVVSPGLVTSIRLPNIPMVVVGGLAFALGFAAYFARRHTEFREASDYEQRNELLESQFEPPRPGADVDARLRENGGRRYGDSTDEQLGVRLRQLAVQVLVDAEGLSREDANRQLDDGTWTENLTAASFFASTIDPPAEDVVGTVVGFTSMYERQAYNVIVELEEIAGLNEGGD